MRRPQSWCFLSFATETEFRGGAIVKGATTRAAVANARKLGITPGGEVIRWPIPPEHLPDVPEEMRGRLLTEREIRRRLGGKGASEK
ncbi:MAG TPA: hypothetical protein VIN93_02175 [Bryobacteraceae bacterium]